MGYFLYYPVGKSVFEWYRNAPEGRSGLFWTTGTPFRSF